jgi:hypothetical protein
MPIISVTWEAEIGDSRSKASPGKSMRSYLKKTTKSKSTGGVAPALKKRI